MSLGPDNTICTNEFVGAMRERLEADKPGSGANVDLPDVQKNFRALGQAIYNIVVEHAETTSDTTSDYIFWQWVTDVENWLLSLSQWQQGMAKAFKDWSPTQADDKAIRDAITQLADPGSPPAGYPTSLKGKIR